MARYGYARVSSTGQSLDIQIEKLTQAGCTVIRSEKKSGRTMDERKELKLLFDFIQPGDEIYITRIDRLARSLMDLLAIVLDISNRGAFLKVIEQPFDTSNSFGRMQISILGAFAEFECDIRRERQMEGIAKAKAAGRYGKKGRNKKYSDRDIALRSLEIGPYATAREFHCSPNTVYRALETIKGMNQEGLLKDARVS